MDTTEKTRENRLRRMAERQGLQLVKSRRRDPRALGYGLYMIIEAGEPVSDLDDYTLDLDAAERHLAGKS